MGANVIVNCSVIGFAVRICTCYGFQLTVVQIKFPNDIVHSSLPICFGSSGPNIICMAVIGDGKTGGIKENSKVWAKQFPLGVRSEMYQWNDRKCGRQPVKFVE